MAAPEVTFDLGCGWLHSADRNSFVKIAEAFNFTVDRGGRCRPGASGPTARRFRKRSARNSSMQSTPSTTASKRLRRGRQIGRDCAAEACLEPGNRWNPMIEAISTYMNGCELDQVSMRDFDAY